MAVDVTADYWDAVLAAGRAQGQTEDKIKKLRSAQLLRSLAAKTDFTKAAIEVANNILALRQYLKENQRDYAQLGKLRETERDRIEEAVGAFVRSCSANIDKLQQMLAPGASPGRLSEDMMAHRQGMVLILSERLRNLTTAFDGLRSLRYQQLQQQEANRLRRLPPVQLVQRAVAAQQAQQGQQRQQQAQLHRRRQQPGGPPTLPEAVPGAPPEILKPVPPQRGLGVPRTTGQVHEALSSQRAAWQEQQQREDGAAAGQRQQQALMDPENQALQLELMSMGEQVTQAERTVREIATLNQMFSTTIMHQSEQIEQLYSQAVEASQSIATGNVQLRKAIRTSTSSRKYLLVFLLVASLGLLLFDWWNS